MRKIAIIGGNSKIGYALSKLLAQETKLEQISFNHIEQNLFSKVKWFGETMITDFFDKVNFRKLILSYKPHIIVNCFELSDIIKCENEKSIAQKYNVEVTENLIKAAKILNSHFIQISSSEVFDCLAGPYFESDIPEPVNYYGKTKLAAENLVIPSQLTYTILRVNNVYGYPLSEFDWFDKIINNLKLNTIANVYTNKYFNPAFNDDIARAILKVVDKKLNGTFHIGSSTYLSEFDFVNSIATIFNLDKNNILEKELAVPLNSGLSTLKSETSFNFKFSNFEDSLLSIRFMLDRNS